MRCLDYLKHLGLQGKMAIYDKRIGIKDAVFDITFGIECYVDFRSREIMRRTRKRPFGFCDESTGCMLSEDLSTIHITQNYIDQALEYLRVRRLLGEKARVICDGKEVFLTEEVRDSHIRTEDTKTHVVDPWKLQIPKIGER